RSRLLMVSSSGPATAALCVLKRSVIQAKAGQACTRHKSCTASAPANAHTPESCNDKVFCRVRCGKKKPGIPAPRWRQTGHCLTGNTGRPSSDLANNHGTIRAAKTERIRQRDI